MPLQIHTLKDNLANSTAFMALFSFVTSFYIMPFDTSFARKALSFSALLVILAGLTGLPRRANQWKHLPLILPLIACALGYLSWYYLFLSQSELHSFYKHTHLLARSFLMAALLVFIVSNFRFPFPSWLMHAFFVGGGLCVNAYAIYVGYSSSFDRVQVDMSSATTAAYVFTVYDIFMIGALLQWPIRWRYPLLLVAFLVSYCAILATGTRAAMLVYIIALITQVLVSGKAAKKFLLTLIFAGSTAIFLLEPLVSSRINDINTDLNMIMNEDGNSAVSSLGSRYEMALTGLKLGWAAPLGQSVEQRAAKIQAIALREPNLKSIEIFADRHLHNELIDAFSLRGVGGVAVMVWLYVALLSLATRRDSKNPVLFTLALCMLLYGFSDVIFFSRESYLIYLMGIVFALAFSEPLSKPNFTPDGETSTKIDRHSTG